MGNETNSITGIPVLVTGTAGPADWPVELDDPGRAGPTLTTPDELGPEGSERCCVIVEVKVESDRALLFSKLLTFCVDGIGGG